MKLQNPQSKNFAGSHSQFGQYLIVKDFMDPVVFSCLRKDLLDFFLEGDKFRGDVARIRVEMGSAEWSSLLDASPSWRKFSRQLHKKPFIDWWVRQLSGTAESLYPQLEVGNFIVQRKRPPRAL